MRVVLFASLLKLLISSPVSPACRIVSNVEQEQERSIEVECEDGVRISVKLKDKDEVSSLDVAGKRAGKTIKYLTVTHQAPSMILTLNGKNFDVNDAGSVQEEAIALESLLRNPDFALFPTAARLIHDELRLPGWTSPSVMFLYRLAMSLSDHPILAMSLSDLHSRRLSRRDDSVDKAVYDYHGPSPSKTCHLNGRSVLDLDAFIADRCMGKCGPSCKSCWEFVCGDCCVHTGCVRHDEFCRDPNWLYSWDCLTMRGVLWDTKTKTKYDC